MKDTLKIKIFSFNILEDKLANSDFFINNNKKYLNKHYRNNLLIEILEKEIISNGLLKIFLLQEVGFDVQLPKLYNLFYSNNYNIITVSELLIAFPNSLEPLIYDLGNISKLTINCKYYNFSDNQKNIINSKHKYFIIVKFKEIETNIEFYVCTTHLIATDEKLKKLQLMLLMCCLENFNNVIFGGDFNISTTNPILKLIKEGFILDENGTFKLKKKYKSVYNLEKNFITNYASNKNELHFSEMIDHIFCFRKH